MNFLFSFYLPIRIGEELETDEVASDNPVRGGTLITGGC